MARRSGRRSAIANGSISTTSTPVKPVSEEEPEPERMDEDVNEPAPETPVVEEDVQSQAPESEIELPRSEPDTPPQIQQFPPRRKRLGRPPKNRPPDWDLGVEDTEPPVKRKRGRPPGGGRGRGRGGYTPLSNRVPIDKEGNTAEVVADEIVLPEDPEGETKVDKLGNLLEGREYRVRTFTISGRSGRLYMLSTEPARCTGFRDSYLFFTKHLRLHKVITTDEEKRDLISRDVIPHSYKGRAIGVVTARSVFREFGSRIVVGGRRIIDDYKVAEYKASGVTEGELADPNDRLPPPGEPYNKNQYVAWHGASAVYHTSGPTVPLQPGQRPQGKRKIQITHANWMVEHALATSRYNSQLTEMRRQVLGGIYDPHTNIMMRPQNTQPTHVRWQQVNTDAAELDAIAGVTNGVNGAHNGDGHEMEIDGEVRRDLVASRFPPPTQKIARNFIVVDTEMRSPLMAGFGPPGSDTVQGHPDYAKSLSAVPDDVLAELPPDCRQAFDEAKSKERDWMRQWGREKDDGMRGHLRIGYTGFPV
ncbi:hypothetical protein P152DRAFT_471478 [Eremomyces bilateralis CBS 781.70]|uniref:Nuclear localization protein n=1 Tax=Eremomyces bilateralis CBS 781.70 TaxID=1392243 RepID=A0A6G1GA77_9PEZI|nr:uncharacterized protein P152DRAFT_471478 [Eremomyces bilateralis CBS 781.70]KAF1814811.1 hypothetical protein P152DRAFT_471478 [Eremomyces bilateralis CBS 781.70]